MANTFQEIVKEFGLTKKILAVNAGNASSNDTKTTKLDGLDNTFDKDNQVRCFNHTLQLSTKTLLKLFNIVWSSEAMCDNETDEFTDNGDGNLATLEDDEYEGGEDEELANEEAAVEEGGVEDDNIEELDELSHND